VAAQSGVAQGSGGIVVNIKKLVTVLFSLLIASLFAYYYLSPLSTSGRTRPTSADVASGLALSTAVTAPSLAPDSVGRFAVIGDYGEDSANEARVAALIAGWNPDFVITTGDNNYPSGEANTIDKNVGKYYSQFIGNYQGQFGDGSPVNRFWPSIGNHDWQSINCRSGSCSGPYMDYFTLPGNERYYDVDYGLVHLFALNSIGNEPDGDEPDSVQGNWLQSALSASESCFDVVFMHHPPYSSGKHGSDEEMQWPFAEWGAETVMSGHEHSYERLDVNGMPYFVNGSGGRHLYGFDNIGALPAGVTSVARYNDDFGAMLVTVTESGMTSEFFNADGVLIDQYVLEKTCSVETTATPSPTTTVTASATPSATGTVVATLTPSETPIPTFTSSPDATPSVTPEVTVSGTPVDTPEATATETPTATGSAAPTATPPDATISATPPSSLALYLPSVLAEGNAVEPDLTTVPYPYPPSGNSELNLIDRLAALLSRLRTQIATLLN
jgi:hypothetical protein